MGQADRVDLPSPGVLTKKARIDERAALLTARRAGSPVGVRCTAEPSGPARPDRRRLLGTAVAGVDEVEKRNDRAGQAGAIAERPDAVLDRSKCEIRDALDRFVVRDHRRKVTSPDVEIKRRDDDHGGAVGGRRGRPSRNQPLVVGHPTVRRRVNVDTVLTAPGAQGGGRRAQGTEIGARPASFEAANLRPSGAWGKGPPRWSGNGGDPTGVGFVHHPGAAESLGVKATNPDELANTVRGHSKKLGGLAHG